MLRSYNKSKDNARKESLAKDIVEEDTFNGRRQVRVDAIFSEELVVLCTARTRVQQLSRQL